MRTFATTAVAFLLAGAAAHAQPAITDLRAGDFAFRLPASWQRVEQNGTVRFVSRGAEDAKVSVLMLFTHAMRQPLRTTFDSEWATLQRNYRAQQTNPNGNIRTPGGIDMLTAQAVLRDSANTSWLTQFMGAEYQAKFEGVVFMSNDFESRAFPETLAALNGFLQSLQFSGPVAAAPGAGGAAPLRSAPSAPPTNGPRAAGGLAGVYRSTLASREYTAASGPAVASMVYKYATILGDGTFVEGQPNGGLDGFDRAGELRANPVGWGSWAMTGASGRVEFPAVPGVPGGAITWEMSLRGDVLWLGTRSYRKLDPGDGLTLNGTFMRADRNEYARQTITFTPDGRFTDQGVFRAASVTHRTPRNPFEDDDGRAGSGTYVIGNYTLRLRFSDGRVKQSFFFVPDGQARGDVRTISINTYDFARIP